MTEEIMKPKEFGLAIGADPSQLEPLALEADQEAVRDGVRAVTHRLWRDLTTAARGRRRVKVALRLKDAAGEPTVATDIDAQVFSAVLALCSKWLETAGGQRSGGPYSAVLALRVNETEDEEGGGGTDEPASTPTKPPDKVYAILIVWGEAAKAPDGKYESRNWSWTAVTPDQQPAWLKADETAVA
jgi:hypothetical protein